MMIRKGVAMGFVVSLTTLILVLGMGAVLQAATESVKVSAVISMILAQPGPHPKKVAIFEINQLDGTVALESWKEVCERSSGNAVKVATQVVRPIV
jgi:hypothetical protein